MCIILGFLAPDEVLQLYYMYYKYIHRVTFFCITSKGILIWQPAKQNAWQVKSHQVVVFIIKVIQLYGLMAWWVRSCLNEMRSRYQDE